VYGPPSAGDWPPNHGCFTLEFVEESRAISATIAGRWGPIYIAATDRGVVAIERLTTEEAFEASVVRRIGGPVARAGTVSSSGDREEHLSNGITWVEAFLSGRPPKDHPPIDLADRPAWDQHVLGAVSDIPWGDTASYGEIARRIGAPRASRAVGGALGRNPISFMIPCHRVIASDGTLGGWGGDRWGDQTHRLRNKQELLLREGVTVSPRAG
jgi:O-6-methylguanine DNA methyltransferase